MRLCSLVALILVLTACRTSNEFFNALIISPHMTETGNHNTINTANTALIC
ncbi:hypothetical protein PF005_g28504 [Phytophthora fragariae]|uniref:RxLR effector protein n=2 Tax=Phytophthora TaxID=4783 RepID=A0A6A3SZX1_9STRA|nr:hypothetical protein PF003_g17683 [Phytophthora fragariae]KAE8971836.1 hypothetical protein PR001_g26772 [Phytophthora rubi]KAE8920704.1 hypothetical protein PF009_g29006 [Phytophthora fragariae]KAE8977737.1 hypothetical protein PR002_g24923 [Phytophthora rubi]KAE9066337.1 hypothetical protein PF010_g27849 [Phytophthora fragariae]